MNVDRTQPLRRATLGSVALAAVLFGSAACSLFHKPETAANIAAPGQGNLTLGQLQNQVIRFADDYSSSVAHAADAAAKSAGTREAQVAALRWKLDEGTAAYLSATGENPIWNTLDVVVLTVVSRMVIEDPKTREEFGDAVVPLIETHRELEASAWRLASQILTPDQRGQLESLIAEWRRQNPHERSVGAIHFREFALTTEKGTPLSKLRTGSVFTLLHLDPFAGLDPTTVAIEQSRELAARTVAYLERAPTLVRWQAELLAFQLASQPDPQRILADAERVSKSMEGISKTAEGLPALVDEQRKAAIDQLLAGVAAERKAILEELDAREATIRTLLGETRQTLDAGTPDVHFARRHHQVPRRVRALRLAPRVGHCAVEARKAVRPPRLRQVRVGGRGDGERPDRPFGIRGQVGSGDRESERGSGRQLETRRGPRLLARPRAHRDAAGRLGPGGAGLSGHRAQACSTARVRMMEGRRRGLLMALLLAAPAACRQEGASRPAGSAGPTPTPKATHATFVGREKCAPCHAEEDRRWKDSHHDLAMQEATEKTVLGSFDDASFTHFGVTSTFFKKDGKFFVRTDGPDGKLHEYSIAYTFGVYPLQQYLIAFPGGRVQALNVCWDTRPKTEGGQRWFHLYPNEKVAHDDPLHWTGPYQNWNFMCAECHSTNVKKGYAAASDTYETTFSEIDVSCEACHGPGSAHVAWAEAVKAGKAKKGTRTREWRSC